MSSAQNFAIILAAGLSKRMGTCKTTLPWRGSTLLQYQAEQFLLVGVIPIIVLGPHNSHRQKDCPPISRVVINNAPEQSKTSSIKTGLHALPSTWSSLFISAVDQPRTAEVYRSLLLCLQKTSARIVTPTHQGKSGHPLLFSRGLQPELMSITEEALGLRQIVQRFWHEISRVEFSTSEVLADLNTPDSYRKIRN